VVSAVPEELEFAIGQEEVTAGGFRRVQERRGEGGMIKIAIERPTNFFAIGSHGVDVVVLATGARETIERTPRQGTYDELGHSGFPSFTEADE